MRRLKSLKGAAFREKLGLRSPSHTSRGKTEPVSRMRREGLTVRACRMERALCFYIERYKRKG